MSSLLSAGLIGIDACPIHVEVDISPGMMPKWSTVGLAESAVRESKDRVISAIHNCGYEFPFRRITLNLAPADLKKTGTAYDLPIAIGLLAASGLIPKGALQQRMFLGELSLDGRLRPVQGVLSIAILAREMGIPTLIVPEKNVWEARVIDQVQVLGAVDLPAVVQHLQGQGKLATAQDLPCPPKTHTKHLPDFSDVKGQAHAKRALEIAASGFHNVLMIGAPGTGKSLMASRLASILAPMSFEESLATSKIYSIVGLLPPGESLVSERPFRSPHHTISDAGLIGGGSHPRPGEVSLAHNGVLFLDELTEFRKNVLESLRQPLETRSVTIARAMESLTYPARFLLTAAMNPCPCGHLGNPQQTCHCSEGAVRRYQGKISGPLLDRMDLQIEVPSLAYHELKGGAVEETSAQIRQRVLVAREIQQQRFKHTRLESNSQMGPKAIHQHCALDDKTEKLLERAVQKHGLSARGYHRILKVARTIADLDRSSRIQLQHLSEAIGYRALEKFFSKSFPKL